MRARLSRYTGERSSSRCINEEKIKTKAHQFQTLASPVESRHWRPVGRPSEVFFTLYHGASVRNVDGECASKGFFPDAAHMSEFKL